MAKTALWIPSGVQSTNIEYFRRYINAKNGLDLKTYHELHAWSTHPSTLAQFWSDALEFLKIASPSQSRFASSFKPETMFPPPIFFPDINLNLAEVLLRRATVTGSADKIAVIGIREGQDEVERISWSLLRDRVRQVYDAMLNYGIRAGDRVATVICNTVDTMVISLATLALGAIYSSTSPDMGADAIIQRFGQIKPKLVFTETAYIYGGKKISLSGCINEWSPKLLSDGRERCRVVLLPYQGTYPRGVDEPCSWENFLALGSGQPLQFKQLPFSTPAFILFTSGTTGMPKCILHSAGAAALKVLVDQQLHNDVLETDVVLQFTTTAWVMWVMTFVLLGSGATIVTYHGSPLHPDATQLLKLIQDFKVTVFGTSPRYLHELQRQDIIPQKHFSITSLRTVISTGSILTVGQYEWFYKVGFAPSTYLVSMCGGTDLLGCFVGGVPTLPIYPGEIQAKALGMAVDVLDGAMEQPVSLSNGHQGELVCRRPFPSQPLGFFGPDGLKRYQEAYFARFGDLVWQQGDFMQVVPDTKGIIIYGRSDGVLNPSGIRFGPADIYSITEAIPGIVDAICIGRQLLGDPDENVMLFIKLTPKSRLDEKLKSRIRSDITQKLSRKHVPHYIFKVKDIPHTVNGKRCESHVKCILNGRPLPAITTMENPECLKEYEKIHSLLLSQGRKGVTQAKL